VQEGVHFSDVSASGAACMHAMQDNKINKSKNGLHISSQT
jgi:hypothetical protein